MEFIIKRTIDLNNQEIQSICDLFNNIFESHKKDIYLFQKEFLNSALGFSFHALMIDDDRIVGSHSLIPCNYKYGTKDILTAFSVDTMIEKKYRDFFNLKELVDLTEVEALKYGIKFIFGFPNDNSYPVLKKGLKYKDIGKLSTYIYPYRISAISKKLSYFNFVSFSFCKILDICSLFNSKKYQAPLIDKNRVLYNKYRYEWFDNNYKIVEMRGFQFIYKIELYNNIRTAFLIDIDIVSSYNFRKAILYIKKNECNHFDIIMFVGNLFCNSFPLLKIPTKYEPKKFNFTGKFIDKSFVDDDYFKLENWNVNLSCYDLL